MHACIHTCIPFGTCQTHDVLFQHMPTVLMGKHPIIEGFKCKYWIFLSICSFFNLSMLSSTFWLPRSPGKALCHLATASGSGDTLYSFSPVFLLSQGLSGLMLPFIGLQTYKFHEIHFLIWFVISFIFSKNCPLIWVWFWILEIGPLNYTSSPLNKTAQNKSVTYFET